MEISNPRRILAVSRPYHGLLDLVKGLTGAPSDPATTEIAGTSHSYPIKTSYYTATIPIWLDEISSPTSWTADFLLPEAKEVLNALGAFIVVFRKPVDEKEFGEVKELLRGVNKVVKEGCGYDWDGVCLAVGMKRALVGGLEVTEDEWEDLCSDLGFEFVNFEGSGRNEFSEPVGIDRLKEALETNDWAGNDDINILDELDELIGNDDDDEGSLGFSIDPSETEEEMRGMEQAIYGEGIDIEEDGVDHDEEVEKLQAMILKMQAVRDMGADLPEAERKRLAAKAVGEIMRTL